MIFEQAGATVLGMSSTAIQLIVVGCCLYWFLLGTRKSNKL